MQTIRDVQLHIAVCDDEREDLRQITDMIRSIMAVEAMRRVTRLVLENRTEEVALKFSDLSALLLERQFILCHRSYLVNLKYIAYVRSREVELTNGEVLPVSKYRLEDLKKRLVDYMFDAGGAVPLSYNDRCRIPFGQGFHDAPGSGGPLSTLIRVSERILC